MVQLQKKAPAEIAAEDIISDYKALVAAGKPGQAMPAKTNAVVVAEAYLNLVRHECHAAGPIAVLGSVVTVRGRELKLPAGLTRIVRTLVIHEGRFVGNRQLHEAMLGRPVYADNSRSCMRSAMKRIRMYLRECGVGYPDDLFECKSGHGYRLKKEA